VLWPWVLSGWLIWFMVTLALTAVGLALASAGAPI